MRTAWIFQAIAATPIFVFLGISTFVNLFNTFDTVYVFTTHLCNALFAAGILFTIIVQRRVTEEQSSKTLILRFEVAKSACATALWAWLFLDAIFGPRDAYGWYYDRPRRVMIAAMCSLMLL